MGSLFFWSHSILFTLWLKQVEKHFKPGATPWYFLVYKRHNYALLGPFYNILRGNWDPPLKKWGCTPLTSTDLELEIITRGVTRDFPGNEMSFHWNYSTMLKNLGNRILYDCSQWVRGFKNCINHFSRCPQCREHTWNATIFGIITPRWKIREISYPMIGPIWVEDSKTVSITFLGAPSTENMPEMLQYLELFPMLKNSGYGI